MSTEPSREDQNVAIVEAFLHALEAKDTERAFSLLGDDVVYQNVPLPPDRGKAAVVRTLRALERFVTGFRVTMVNIAARGDVVLTERVDVLSGPFVHVDIWVCGTFEVHGGKIVLWRDYFDLAEATTKLFTGKILRVLTGR